MKRPMFRGKSVTIVCTDMDRSERFYSHLLGAEPKPFEPGTCRWLQLGALTLSLMPNAEERNDVAAARTFLAMNSAPVEEIDDQTFLVADPDGLMIEIWQSDQ